MNDEFVVIASDGVFEFLTNQMVSDMVAAHWNDSLAACKVSNVFRDGICDDMCDNVCNRGRPRHKILFLNLQI